MVYRDPQTGQYQSGSRDSSGRYATVTANIASSIPAADLAGGTDIQSVDGDEAQLIDFTTILDSDEVFLLDQLQGRAFLSAPTTATAEGTVLLEYSLSRDFEFPNSGTSSAFWTGSAQREDGIADVNQTQTDNDMAIWISQMSATPSIADSVNGLAGGSDMDREDIRQHWHGDGRPAFDRDDELVAPHQWQVDNVSDHAVEWDLVVLAEGRIQELD